MFAGKSWNTWVSEYALSHQNPINQVTHIFGIPMIAVSLPMLLLAPFVSGLFPIAIGLFLAGWALQFTEPENRALGSGMGAAGDAVARALRPDGADCSGEAHASSPHAVETITKNRLSLLITASPSQKSFTQ